MADIFSSKFFMRKYFSFFRVWWGRAKRAAWGGGEQSERRGWVWRAKRAARVCGASEASGGRAVGRPCIVAEGDVLQVTDKKGYA